MSRCRGLNVGQFQFTYVINAFKRVLQICYKRRPGARVYQKTYMMGVMMNHTDFFSRVQNSLESPKPTSVSVSLFSLCFLCFSLALTNLRSLVDCQ
jgi:hypothetical protein